MPLRLPKNLPKVLIILFLCFFIFQMVLLLCLLIKPFRAMAAAADPAYLPQCWRQSQCVERCGLESGCYWERSEFCAGGTGSWGRCYPSTAPISLEIKLQGADAVTDVADYIAKIYVYTISIGGILATVMIIWGGVVYLTAGGNPGKIGEAKEYIGNALIGLFLLFTSYLMLQTLNPDLVKLSMPRTYLIRPRNLSGDLCLLLPQTATEPLKFALADKPYEQVGENDYHVRNPVADLSCNTKYYELTRGPDPCFGTACNNNYVCLPDSEDDPTPCKSGIIGGELSWEGGKYLDYINLWLVCADNSIVKVTGGGLVGGAGLDLDDGDHQYLFPDFSGDFYLTACGGRGTPVQGFLLDLEINDAPGIDDNYIIGTSACRYNQGGGASEAVWHYQNPLGNISSFSPPSDNPYLFAGKAFAPQALFDQNVALRCDLQITSEFFPSL